MSQYNRITVFFVALLLCVTGEVKAFLQPTDESSPTEEKPNIIFILTNDQRFDALGYAGNELISTPAMDKLAKEGTYFSNAMVTTPICAASRASILIRKPSVSSKRLRVHHTITKQGYRAIKNILKKHS